jgi:hypothetical protein
MDPIVTIALVGTARQAHVNAVTGTPVDSLIEGLPAGEDERKLLLSAGSWAVYRRAGQIAQQIAAIPEPAPPEKLRTCLPTTALVLSRLLNGEQADLLPEALAQLREVGMHLPYDLLPLALNKSGKALRTALFPVLGERGIWLSRFNPAWNWVQDFLPADESGLPADAETIWQEGTAAQRVEILRRLRAVDSEKGRAWLEAVWKQEKAEMRCDLLETWETSLSADDGDFLEKALDDRAASVRTVAVSLLTHLPDSAFATRMLERGRAMLSMVKSKLTIKVPNEIGKDWQRDGIIENPPNKLGRRAWLLIQVLGSISPTFWETHLGATPTELLDLVSGDKWEVNMLNGWSLAAVRYNAHDWVGPLWKWWLEHYNNLKGEQITDYTIREKLLQAMFREETENVVVALFSKAPEQANDQEWANFLSELPRPWSDAFGHTFLRLLRTHCLSSEIDVQKFNPYNDPWFSNLSSTALALPASCLGEASQPWEFPIEESNWQINYARQMLQNFVEVIQMRQKIYEEIV